MSEIEVIVLGGLGRLGSAVVQEIKKTAGLHLRAALDRNDSLKNLAKSGDVVVDATGAQSVAKNLQLAMELKTPMVLAATGYDESVKARISDFGKKLPIVVAPNLSVGVAVLHEMVSKTAQALPEADMEIVETHHVHKKDMPSGTALLLQVATGKKDLPIRSVREGEVVGKHEVHFRFNGESIILVHEAFDRAIFARGAVLAVKFVALQKPGVYTMHDVIWPSLP